MVIWKSSKCAAHCKVSDGYSLTASLCFFTYWCQKYSTSFPAPNGHVRMLAGFVIAFSCNEYPYLICYFYGSTMLLWPMEHCGCCLWPSLVFTLMSNTWWEISQELTLRLEHVITVPHISLSSVHFTLISKNKTWHNMWGEIRFMSLHVWDLWAYVITEWKYKGSISTH